MQRTVISLLCGIALLLVAGAVEHAVTRPAEPLTRLQQVQQRGHLVMLTRNGASTYFTGGAGATGPEYDLARAFADYLGVGLEVRVAGAFQQLAEQLEAGEGDFIAANLTRTPQRERRFRFGPDYAQTTTEVVVRRGLRRPASLTDLVGLRLAVIAGTSYEELLQAARAEVPGLSWESRAAGGMEDLLLEVEHGDLDATLVDGNILALNRPYYPGVNRAFTLGEPLPQAWAFAPGVDDSLVKKAHAFMREAEADGRLAAIRERYDPVHGRLDQVGMLHFMRQVRERLPQHLGTFQQVAQDHDLDWRFLAAMGYQESHWDAAAASPTGVRGLMMLTRVTARQVGLDDRLDPQQSILGGARYFRRMHAKIPDRIPEPDRTNMALAAYNMGYGHLEDARVLTQRLGGDPDRWEDVNRTLPLLTQEKYHSTLRYGYARGHEAQSYVRNVRDYYEVLNWMDTREHPLLVAQQTYLAP